jgi:hypothetical protein
MRTPRSKLAILYWLTSPDALPQSVVQTTHSTADQLFCPRPAGARAAVEVMERSQGLRLGGRRVDVVQCLGKSILVDFFA